MASEPVTIELPPIGARREPRGPRRVRNLSSLVRWFAHRLPRKMTEAEASEALAEKQRREQQRLLYQTLNAEAEKAARLIADVLVDLNICYRYKETERSMVTGRVKRIEWSRPFGLMEDELRLYVDLGPGARPNGVGVEALAADETLNNLSVAVGRKITAKYNERDGFYYSVYRTEAAGAIPAHVKYDDVLALKPASADSLSFPLGMTTGQRVVWRSLGDMISLLVAGTTGGGKSNFLRVLISTLVNQNSPRRLRLGLIDLKRGVEFAPYLDLKHVLSFKFEGDDHPAVIDKREEVAPFLNWLVHEGEARLDRFKDSKVTNIGQYNRKHPFNPMAHIVVVIDEWADIKLDPKAGPAAQELLINVASRFRAAGVHLVCCTQYPQKEVVSMRLKAVLPAKLAFSMPNIAGSIMVLNNSNAHNLREKGRAVYQYANEEITLQVPLITNEKVDEIVSAARDGTRYKAEFSTKHDVTPDEVFEWAVRQNGGKLSWRAMYTAFKARGFSQKDAQQFPDQFADQIVSVGSSSYRVVRPARPGEAWIMLPLEESSDAEPSLVSDAQAPDLESFTPDEAQRAETATDAELTEVHETSTVGGLVEVSGLNLSNDGDREAVGVGADAGAWPGGKDQPESEPA